jgi:MoxR-like ATPase
VSEEENDVNVLELINDAREKSKRVIVGQDDLIDSVIAALVCEGHLLIEGMPGVGKTLSCKVLSKLCDLAFKRIQFTPDLLPSDLIGTLIYSQKNEEFSTKFGPIFTQILLADEINRSPPKVQSALLEAMGEYQVTIGEETHKLLHPFVVLATQNPIDHEGTYPLPEAQLDRFMMKVKVGYPGKEDEVKILNLSKDVFFELESVLSTDDLLEAQERSENIFVDDKIKEIIVHICQATRPDSPHFFKEFRGAIAFGVSPRASLWLLKLSKYMAFIEGKDFVTPEHLLKIIPGVMGHRIILSYEAKMDRIDPGTMLLNMAQKLI